MFKKVEKDVFPVQERIRAAAKEREVIKKTKRPSLFAPEDLPPSRRAVTLRQRYLAAALKRVEELRGNRKQVPYDEIWDAAMAFPLVWDSDVKTWIAEWKKDRRVRVLNLKPKQRVPQWGQNHVIECIK